MSSDLDIKIENVKSKLALYLSAKVEDEENSVHSKAELEIAFEDLETYIDSNKFLVAIKKLKELGWFKN